MIKQLNNIIKILPDLIKHPEKWDSLIINRRKPFTYRAFHIFKGGEFDGIRVCLHKFDPCDEVEAFFHPHPWPSAMMVLVGQYKMRVGGDDDLNCSKPSIFAELILAPGSQYSMADPGGWHSVQPLETCYSVMVNGPPWGDLASPAAPTTKGKDLDKMDNDGLHRHLATFHSLLAIRHGH